MNKKLFLFLYGLAEKNKIIGKISIIGTKLSYYIFLTIYIIFGLYVLYSTPRDNNYIIYISKYFFIPMFALIINTMLRKLLKKERPFSELGKQSLIGHKKSYSFPSNHAASAMVISIAIIYALSTVNGIGILVLILAFLTGLSRIMTGVHYPLDVLGGWFVGGVIGFIGFFYL